MSKHDGHYILPTRVALTVGAALLVLTGLTVAVAHVDLGWANFPVALLVATVKALLVCAFFMGLKYDKRENSLIFGTSFVFLIIFIGLTSFDWFYRGDVVVKPGDSFASAAKSKFKKAWEPRAELVAHGKELYALNCASCHGAGGAGDGAAAAALNPKPRNFTAGDGWKNGRKPSQVFKTLKEGLGGMPAFASLPADDRWALAHFVVSLGPKPLPTDGAADLAKAGVDTTKGDAAGGGDAPTIPVSIAMDLMAEPDTGSTASQAKSGADVRRMSGAGVATYVARCLECHGADGRGSVVASMGGQARLRARAFKSGSEWIQSAERFQSIVIQGLPGHGMPGNGQLSSGELRDLHATVRSLAAGASGP